jgi:predicted ribosomally synthesized peptide with SipW-like signal peptide
MKNKALLSLVLTGALAIGAASASFAYFTSSATTTSNTIQTGQLKFNLSANGNSTSNEKAITLSTKAQPGDTLTIGQDGNPGSFKIEIINNGDFDMTYFDNFKVLKDDSGLQDVIYIKNARNSLYNTSGAQVWEEIYFTNGVKKYAFVDANNDGKISLREWLANANQSISIGNGWHYSALKKGAKFVTEYELAMDTKADNSYINKYIQLGYQTYATQFNKDAAQEMITNTIKPGSGALDWDFVQAQYNQQ